MGDGQGACYGLYFACNEKWKVFDTLRRQLFFKYFIYIFSFTSFSFWVWLTSDNFNTYSQENIAPQQILWGCQMKRMQIHLKDFTLLEDKFTERPGCHDGIKYMILFISRMQNEECWNYLCQNCLWFYVMLFSFEKGDTSKRYYVHWSIHLRLKVQGKRLWQVGEQNDGQIAEWIRRWKESSNNEKINTG